MSFIKFSLKLLFLFGILVAASGYYFYTKHTAESRVEISEYTVQDATGLNQIEVAEIVRPQSERDVVTALANSQGAVSIGGARYSMGGQIAYPDSLHLDMRDFNQVIAFDADARLITVQSGMTWWQLQQFIDPHDLSVKVMQDFNNFTIGGSLSVNAHGRFLKTGPLINSVRSIRIVLADGQVYEASPERNPALFYGAIGSYGALGVITHVTLELVPNIPLRRSVKNLEFHDFLPYFREKILDDSTVELHHAVLYPPNYESLTNITWRQTDEPLTEERRLRQPSEYSLLKTILVDLVAESNLLKRLRKNLVDPYLYRKPAVVWRNWETSYDLNDFGFLSTDNETLALRIYMVPVEEFEIFVLKMRDIFIRHNASVLNISIRYVPRDPGSLLAWAREDVFSFTIIYHQDKDAESLQRTEAWSQKLIKAAIDSDGSFYLPFQIHETTEQFAKAYPNAGKLFELKQIADPGNRFRNMLWLEHYAGNMADKIAFEKAAQTPPAVAEDEDQLVMQPSQAVSENSDKAAQDQALEATAAADTKSTAPAQSGPDQSSTSEN